MVSVLRTALAMIVALAAAFSFAGTLASPVPSAPVLDHLTMGQLAEKYKGQFHNDPAPAGLSPTQQGQYWLDARSMQGRTPQEWVDYVHRTFNTVDLAPVPTAHADLVESVLRLDALALGTPVPAPDRLALAAQAATLDPTVRDAFADAVAAVADAYAAQLPLSRAVNARFLAEFDHGGLDLHHNLLTNAERDAMAARAASVLDALNTFRVRTAGRFGPAPLALACAPLFADPANAVVLGNTCDNTYERASGPLKDPVLIIDPAGDDTYHTYAGGADPAGLLAPGSSNLLVLSVVYDIAGNDTYSYSGIPATVQGAGSIGAIGMLVDVQGNDRYLESFVRTGSLSILDGIEYYFEGGGQGYGYGGFGLLLDGTGNDVYHITVSSTNGRSIWALGQGFGGLGGLGIASDGVGDDDWLTNGLGISGGTGGFQGLYTQGVGFYGGTGISSDTGLGADDWINYDNSTTTDFYAVGFGAFEGVGIMYDDGGANRWIASSDATGSWINPLLNCAYGTASLGGYGVMFGLVNDDYYSDDTISATGKAHTMVEGFGGVGWGVGVFVDLGGVDQHLAFATGNSPTNKEISGRGVVVANELSNNLGLGEGANLIAFYLDVGGVDTYVPASIGNGPNVGGKDGSTGTAGVAAWANGADINTV